MTVRAKELTPEQYAWLQRKLAGFSLSPEQWISLLVSYGVPADRLTGDACACPMCGGTDRFTYDNKRGRGDWVCRHCNNGDVMAGDGLQLITRVNRMGLYRLMREIDGGPAPRATRIAGAAEVPKPKRKASPEFTAKRLNSMWNAAKPLSAGDLVMRYLGARVAGLRVAPSPALRLGMLEYRHEKKVIGSWPGILARFELPDGRLGTLHRTFLERSTPSKAQIVSSDGEILDPKLNDMTLNPLAGGAVRLMEPKNGEIGVAEGLETACAAHMLTGVPMWYCLNIGLLRQFVVPEGFGIRVVHIFVDFDAVDPKTGKSVGVAGGVELAKRLRAEGFTAIVHRPRLRGTDFADEWMTRSTNSVPLLTTQRVARSAAKAAATA
ncbi:P4 alpha zinc-binding domain protein [Paraburkholderia ribeironis]|uniref:p4 alpha zinc-binding domain protein n=1 Tax=Paraburkholderia ribeironis TaxID=1247936 RepID=A0A1N7RIG6_9BURK|nr:primase-helicase zinc-binding domain-containing protein [Paraburkholderia ribeironis]SIT34892.1 P4 alpha zinc-binding domain protein [Paraburkholderia ribeironis]